MAPNRLRTVFALLVVSACGSASLPIPRDDMPIPEVPDASSSIEEGPAIDGSARDASADVVVDAEGMPAQVALALIHARFWQFIAKTAQGRCEVAEKTGR